MITRIDIVGIGNKIMPLPQKNDDEFESLDNYYTIAKKMILVHAPTIRSNLAEEMLANEDAVGNVAHALMMADWKFDGRGNLYGYRKKMGRYAIQNYASRQKKETAKKNISINNDFESSTSTNFFANQLTDKEQQPDMPLQKLEKLDKIRELLESGIISKLQAEYLRLYYFEGLSLDQIGKKRKVSKQSVWQLIHKALETLKEYIRNDQFFRGIIYED